MSEKRKTPAELMPAHAHARGCTAKRYDDEVVTTPPRDGFRRSQSANPQDVFERIQVIDEVRRIRCVDCGAFALFALDGEEALDVGGR